jgi:hypothetical protein
MAANCDRRARQEHFMFGTLGLLGVVAGAVVAYTAERWPAHIAVLETGAGVLLIGGLALTGYALPAMI